MTDTAQPHVAAFAYAGFETPEYERWSKVGPGVFGFEVAAAEPDGAIRLRTDDRHHRLAVHPGERNRVAYLGWDVADEAMLNALVARIEAAGISVEREDPSVAQLRRVRELVSFVDPFGQRHELVLGATETRPWKPGRPMRGSFVTGDGGAGHAVLMSADLEASTKFYTDVLGFKLSDTITSFTEIRFFHTNARHHSVAIVSSPGVRGLHHLMFELSDLDDVGMAYDQLADHEVPITMTLGRHPNDRMLSFYCRVPGGFEVEYGWGGLRIESDEPWTPGAFDHTSEWGHKPQDSGMPGMIEILAPA